MTIPNELVVCRWGRRGFEGIAIREFVKFDERSCEREVEGLVLGLIFGPVPTPGFRWAPSDGTVGIVETSGLKGKDDGKIVIG